MSVKYQEGMLVRKFVDLEEGTVQFQMFFNQDSEPMDYLENEKELQLKLNEMGCELEDGVEKDKIKGMDIYTYRVKKMKGGN
ncbi:hypothetical protein P4493_05765 [Bacillus thuringiensis]|uniref:Uncharacterized protein n=3 Tax=Bacillus thuringiensis TaxID=1428 RepID=A0A0B5NBT4_BACTU|nr:MULTISPECIES: hypothetical protein [Bacillus]MEC2533069.1 hypothetical protein [Bacillus cereus]MED1153951.1 hypothetical protein [Bacillus paranthracis]OUB09209.1 hypothetical protein BK708_32250 [Bacillus thuringiensis serovar yunnanensis]AFQ29823.1 hypothetical protein BTF1_28612 [Bacillus thuringiensis HD-789]AJG73865.1 hypothetical protein BF38_6067 [Bacillus thuringiensis]